MHVYCLPVAQANRILPAQHIVAQCILCSEAVLKKHTLTSEPDRTTAHTTELARVTFFGECFLLSIIQ